MAAVVFEQSMSIVLPAFNEEECIETAISQCVELLDQRYRDWEVVVVDDGSADETVAIVERMIRQEPRIKLVRHPRNLGYGCALRSGFEAARGELVFFTDSDCQFDVRELVDLMPLAERYDAVFGFRVYRYDSVTRCTLSWIYNRLVRVMFLVKIRDVDCSFKLFTRRVVDNLHLESRDFFVDTEMVARTAKMGARIVEKGVRHYPRQAGHTTVRPSHIPRTLWTVFRMWFHIHFSRRWRVATTMVQPTHTPTAKDPVAEGEAKAPR